MNIETLLSDELLSIISNEIVDVFDKESSKILIDKTSLILKESEKESETLEVLINRFNKDKNLSKLKKTLSIFSFLNDNIEDLQIIDKVRLENPDNKLYVYIWLYLKFEVFEGDEYFEYQFIDFLTEVFAKYEWLMETEVFINSFYSLYTDNDGDIWLSNQLLKVFVNASKKYPDFVSIKDILIWAYYSREEYNKALDLVKLRLNVLDLNKDSANYKSHKIYYLIHRAELLFKQNKLDKALSDADYIIDQAGYDDVIGYANVFGLRIGINLKKNNLKQLDSDCLILINSLELFYIKIALQDRYPEALKCIEEFIVKIAKQHTSKYNKTTKDKIFAYTSEIGRIEISGNDNWKLQDEVNPIFKIKLKNNKNISIKIQELIEGNLVTNIEVIDGAKLTEDEQGMIINWLNLSSLMSEKNIGIKTTNIKYISMVLNFLNAENTLGDIYI